MLVPFPISRNESLRLEALADLQVLDTPPEREFDQLTLLATQLLDAPMALISLVDRDRQWFKSKRGLRVNEMSRSHAFCAHAIASDAPFLVRDAQRDDRFKDNPLVVSAPHIRGYLGIPLIVTGGHAIGTLCVLDHREIYPTRLQRRQLATLAKIVVNYMEMRAAMTNNWPRPIQA